MSDMLQLAKLLEEVRAGTRLQSEFLAQPVTKITDRGFDDLLVDLADGLLAGSGSGLPLLATGYGVTYLRRGSTPGGLLTVSGMGLKQPFAPGDEISGYFESGDALLKSANGSAVAGTAVLRVWLQPQAKFRESPVEVPVTPTALLGSMTTAGVITFATAQVEDVVPSGAASGVAGAFSIAGWRRALVLIDTQSGGVEATSFVLNPFYQVPGGTLWFDQGETQSITFAGTNPASGRYRMAEINLSQAQGSLYLGIRNLLLASRTTLSLCVLGVG